MVDALECSLVEVAARHERLALVALERLAGRLTHERRLVVGLVQVVGLLQVVDGTPDANELTAGAELFAESAADDDPAHRIARGNPSAVRPRRRGGGGGLPGGGRGGRRRAAPPIVKETEKSILLDIAQTANDANPLPLHIHLQISLLDALLQNLLLFLVNHCIFHAQELCLHYTLRLHLALTVIFLHMVYSILDFVSPCLFPFLINHNTLLNNLQNSLTIMNELGAVCEQKSFNYKRFLFILRNYSGLKIKQSPLLQNLLPDSLGPSLKTCP